MLIFWIFGFVGAADWEVSCNADSIKVLIDPNLLEQQTGSRDHRLVFQGRRHFTSRNCQANLNNIPRSTNRGKIELILYQNFQQCSTLSTQLTADELGDGDHVNDYKYKNTVYFNAAGGGDIGTISSNFPDVSSFIDPSKQFYNLTPSDSANNPVVVPLFEWECRYPHSYDVQPSFGGFIQESTDLEVPSALSHSNTDCSTLTGFPSNPNCFPFTNLYTSAFGYTTPEFKNEDIINSYKFTDSSQTFFIIDPTWLSIQTFLSSLNPTELDASGLRTSLKYCWISNSVSNDITINEKTNIVIEGCPVTEDYVTVFSTGLGYNTRFAFDASNPQLDYLNRQLTPFYLHCQLRICFPGEECPGSCDHGKPDELWNIELDYEPLILATRSGPYFMTGSPALDFNSVIQVQTLLPNEAAAANNRLLPDILTDEEIYDQMAELHEDESLDGPDAFTLVISLLGSFFVGSLLIGIIIRNCRRKGIYRVARRERQILQ